MQVPIPKFSLIEKSFDRIDYFDCFMLKSDKASDISFESCIYHFFYDYPIWIKWLFQLRLKIGSLFGDTKPRNTNSDFFKPEISLVKGGKASFFTVVDLHENEIMLKATDTHLDACLSFFKHTKNGQCELTISTTVHFNNRFGKIYFFFIKPFHKLIIIALLKRFIGNLQDYKQKQ